MSVEESPALLKREPEEESCVALSDYDEARVKSERALLYADHEIKDEIVIGPTEIRRPPPPEVYHTHWEASRSAVTNAGSSRLVLQDASNELLCARCGHWSPTTAELNKDQVDPKTSATVSRGRVFPPTLPSPSSLGPGDGWMMMVPLDKGVAQAPRPERPIIIEFVDQKSEAAEKIQSATRSGPSSKSVLGKAAHSLPLATPGPSNERKTFPLPEVNQIEVPLLEVNQIEVPLPEVNQIEVPLPDVNQIELEIFFDDGENDGSDIDIDIDIDEEENVYLGGNISVSHQINPDNEDYANDTNILEEVDRLNDDALTDLLGMTHFDWTNDPKVFTGVREKFTGNPGPTFPLAELEAPVDSFLKMVEPHFVDMIVTETNDYAQQVIEGLDAAGKLSARSRFRKWQATDKAEMYRFLALLIAQGLTPNPAESGYWYGSTKMPLFYENMRYDRFLLLKKFIHFTKNRVPTDNMTRDEKRLHKIQPVVDYFRGQFKRLYYPDQEVAIDESLLNWKGLLSFTQKIATKAAQVGIKSYELCTKNGYLWDFFYYTGKKANGLDFTDDAPTKRDDNDDERDGNDTDKDNERTLIDLPRPTNATAKIVIDLAAPLFGRGHTIIMDNFYNSPLLVRFLKNNGCDSYGTLRLNRKHVPESMRGLTRSSMNSGDIVTSNTHDITVIVWRDTGLVAMISSYHKPAVGHQTKYGKAQFKPAVVLDYNKAMGGVDRKDQILSAQPMERARNLVWYKKVFRRLLNTALFNSHIIYQAKFPNISHRNYRDRVVLDLLTRFSLPALQGAFQEKLIKTRGRAHFKRVVLEHRHFAVRNCKKSACCLWCSVKSKRKSRTIYKCKECDVNLCIDFCFEDFHTAPLQ